MRQLQFFKGLSWLLALNLMIKPLWIFFIDRQVQNVVGNEVYGNYFALFNLSYVLLFVADAGLSNYTTQQIAGGNIISTRQLFSIKLLLLGIYISVAFGVGILTQVSQWGVFLLATSLQAAGSLLLFLRGLIAGSQLFRLDAWLSIADKLFVTLLAGIFLYGWVRPITIEIFLQLQIAATLAACAFAFFWLMTKRILTTNGHQPVKNIIKQAAPFAAIILLMAAHYRADGFLLERLNSAMQAGIYASAYRLLDAGNMIGYLVASFLVPFIARHQQDGGVVKKVVELCRNALLGFGIFASCFAVVFSPWIQATLYSGTDAFNTEVIQLTMAVLPAYYLIHVYGSLLTATSNFNTFIFILLAAVVINLSANTMLIPIYGAKGSAIAALISQYCCAFACYLTASKKLRLPISYQTWLAYGGLSIATLLLLFILQITIHSVWIILAVVLLLLGVVTAVQGKQIKNYIQSIIQ